MQLERLYKLSTKGATQVIDMVIEGDTYTRTWGQLDGKMQNKATTAKGKNIGRSNETTPEQQAIIEAEAVWVKKQKTNYSTSMEAPVSVKLPMKVSVYQKNMKKVTFPCYTSVKLNGVNAEYRIVDGALKLLSRGGEEYPIPDHQRAQATTALAQLDTDSINGEMYTHGAFLQDIMAATKKTNDDTPALKFFIFDFPNMEGDYKDRCTSGYCKLNNGQTYTPELPLVNVGVAYSHKELDEQHAKAVAAGYEGIMVRNGKGVYAYNTRSLDVFKYKVAQDGEYKSIGFKLDKNSHPVFNCLVDPTLSATKDNTFEVKLKGTSEARTAMGLIADTLIGQFIKVEYEMLSKIGKPQKPVGIMFRKVDADGEAIE